VVEGKEDASYLSNYIDSEIVTVQGYELSDPIISYLKDKRVIALLDPDEAGKTIRKRLNEKLTDVINIEIDIKKCTRGVKNGVAECEIDEIMAKLEPYFTEKARKSPIFDVHSLYELGISENKQLRDYVCTKLNLGKCNNKQLLKRINASNVQLDQLKKIIEEYKHGN
jgi:ribonuclease M5